MNAAPFISCLCVTENRPAFMPWLLWNYDRQTWPARELIIVDSSPAPFRSGRPDVHIIAASPGTGVAAKRNLALQAAQGEIIAWFDDDDWQRPQKLARLAEALAGGAPYAGSAAAWFVDLWQERCVAYRTPAGEIIFNSAGFRREAVAGLRFPESARRASDTRWLRQIAKRYPNQAATLKENDLFFWLCHQDNLSNPAGRRRFPQSLASLRQMIGDDAWGDSDAELAALRARLAGKSRPTITTPARPPSLVQSDTPRVTVTIPYYRCRSGIRRAVESVLDQSYSHLRLVVVNDGDPAPPWDLLADIDDPRLTRFELARNMGRYFADAVVVEASDDPYYLVQDADDWSEPERLERLLARLTATNGIAAVSAARLFHNGAKQGRLYQYGRLKQPPSPRFEFRAAHHGLFRADILRALGGYYGGYEIGYDTLLMNVLPLIGPIAYDERPLYNRRIRQNSLTTSPSTGMQSRRRRQVRQELGQVYAQAYQYYRQYQAGALDQAGLVQAIGQLCRGKITPAERQLLRQESDRLRLLLAGEQGHDPAAEIVARLSALADDPRLEWDTEWRPARVTAGRLIERLAALRPRNILELGSGNTTALFAAYAAASGASTLTLEHLPAFRRQTLRLLRDLGLAGKTEVRYAPLHERTMAGERFYWYAYEPAGPFDFVFIDGPPRRYGRAGALFALWPALAPRAEIWLHDGLREDERACIRRWREAFTFAADLQEWGKGVWIIKTG